MYRTCFQCVFKHFVLLRYRHVFGLPENNRLMQRRKRVMQTLNTCAVDIVRVRIRMVVYMDGIWNNDRDKPPLFLGMKFFFITIIWLTFLREAFSFITIICDLVNVAIVFGLSLPAFSYSISGWDDLHICPSFKRGVARCKGHRWASNPRLPSCKACTRPHMARAHNQLENCGRTVNCHIGTYQMKYTDSLLVCLFSISCEKKQNLSKMPEIVLFLCWCCFTFILCY